MDLSLFANKRFDTLKSLQDASVTLLKSNKFNQALACMVQILKCKSKSFGNNSKEVVKYMSNILKKFTLAVGKLIEVNEIEVFSETLNKILVLTKTCRYKRVNKQLCRVIHSYSCVLRRIRSLSLAYDYALKALKVGNTLNGSMRLMASVYLNVSSILSQLNEHSKALEYCKVAVKLAESCLNKKNYKGKPEKFKDSAMITTLTYYNLAVETETLGNLKEAQKWFETGLGYLKQNSSIQNSSLVKEFKIALKSIAACLNENNPGPISFKPLKTVDCQHRDIESPGIFANTNDSWKKTMKIEDKYKLTHSSLSLKSDIPLNNSNYSLPYIPRSSKRSHSSQNIHQQDSVTKTNSKFHFNPSPIPMPQNYKRELSVKKNSNITKSYQTKIALIKIQAFTRMVKVRKWYKQYKNRKFTEKILSCERTVKLGKWDIFVELKKKTLICKIKVKDQFGVHKKKFSLFEICNTLGIWTGEEFEKEFFKIFLCVKLEKNKVGLSRLNEISLRSACRVVKNCNIGNVRVEVFLACGGRLGKCLMFFPEKVNKRKVFGRILISRVKDVALLMGIKEMGIYENFSQLNRFLRILDMEGGISIVLEEDKDLGRNEVEKYKKMSEGNIEQNNFESNKRKASEVEYGKLLADPENRKVMIYKFIQTFKHFLLFWKGRNFNSAILNAFPSVIILKNFEKKIKAPIKSLFKMIFVQNILNPVENCRPVILIQSFVRMHITRSYFLKISSAVLTCQRQIRGFLCRKRLRSQNFPLKINEKNAIPPVQESDTQIARLTAAVKMIQRHFKGYKIRRIFRFFLSLGLESSFSKVLHSVTVIQKIFRGFRVRRSFQIKSVSLMNSEIFQNKSEILKPESPIKPKIIQKKPEIQIKPKLIPQKAKSPIKPELLTNKAENQKKPDFLTKKTESPKKLEFFQKKPEIKNKIEYPKNMYKGKEILIKGLGNSLIFKLLNSAVTIQRYTRGWICRKHLKMKIKLTNEIKAALCLQRFFRGWKVRKNLEELKTGVLIIEWSGLILEDIPYITNISKLADDFIIKAVNLQNFSALYLRTRATEPASITFSRLFLLNGWLKLLKTPKPQDFSLLLQQEKRVVSWDPYLIKVILEPSCISISVQGVSHTQFLKLGLFEVVERFSERFKAKEIINDLTIEPSRVFLSNQVVILKKSRYFHEKLYTVNMFEKKNTLIFEVMFDSSLKKRTFVDLNEAQIKTGIFSGKLALGTFIIDHCIAVHGKRVKINLKQKKSCSETEAIVKLQAKVRAFLARKRLSRKNLVLVCTKVINSKEYKLYCHYFSGSFNITAVAKHESYNLIIEKKLPYEQMLNYLRKKIVPNLHLTKTTPYKLIMKLTIATSEKMIFKPKVSNSLGQNKNTDPVNLLSLTTNQNFSEKKNEKKNFKQKKPPEIRIRRKQFSDVSEEIDNQMKDFKLPPPSTPVIALNCEKTQPVEIIKSQEVHSNIFKSGITLSGIYLIITMQIQGNGIYIQGTNESGTIEAELFVKLKNLENMKNKKLEKLCADLLSRLKLVSSIDGKLKLSILENEEDDRDLIIYRRVHNVSNKLFLITIFENVRGVFLIATQDENQVFNLKIGKKRVGNSQIVQEELSILVKKLKIQVFLGQEILVISA